MNESLQGIFQSNNQFTSLIVGVIIIFIIFSIVRSVFRIVLPFVVIGLVMVVFLGHSPNEVINKGKQLVAQGSAIIQEVLPFVQSERENTEVPETPPGSAPFSKEEIEKFLNRDEGNQEKETFESNERETDINKF